MLIKKCLKKILLAAVIFLLLALVSCPEEKSDSEAMTNKTAFEFFQDIKLGINTGNTLDAHKNGVSGENLWSNRKLSQRLFDGFKRNGLDIVRVPVTWMGHIGPAPDYIIEPALLERVAEVKERKLRAFQPADRRSFIL